MIIDSFMICQQNRFKRFPFSEFCFYLSVASGYSKCLWLSTISDPNRGVNDFQFFFDNWPKFFRVINPSTQLFSLTVYLLQQHGSHPLPLLLPTGGELKISKSLERGNLFLERGEQKIVTKTRVTFLKVSISIIFITAWRREWDPIKHHFENLNSARLVHDMQVYDLWEENV